MSVCAGDPQKVRSCWAHSSFRTDAKASEKVGWALWYQAARLKAPANPRAQALVLSATGERAEIARAVESGAAGVLHKSSEMAEVADAVRRLRAGQTLMPLDEVVELLRFAGARKDEEHYAKQAISNLTERELEVLSLLAEGLEAQEIAARLHISAKTERNHVANILSKLGAHSRLQAVLFAGRHGLVELGTKDA